MKKKVLIFCISNLLSFSSYAVEVVPLPSGRIESPFDACKDVIIVDKAKYDNNREKWDDWQIKCHRQIQTADESGFTKFSSFDEAPKYLNIAHKVAAKALATIEKSQKYAQCSSVCFSGAATCDAKLSTDGKAVDCKVRQKEILETLKIKSREIRKELSLSRVTTDVVNVNERNVWSLGDRLLNLNLRPFEPGPNPLGGVDMHPEEVKVAKAILKTEQDKIEQAYKEMLKQKGVKDSTSLKYSWMSSPMVKEVDKIHSEHQDKYRTLIYETPIFAVIDKPLKFVNGNEAIWSDKQIASAFSKLSEYAMKAKEVAKDTIAAGKLEFSRTNGDAFTAWLSQQWKGSKDKNDLLYYMRMKNQVNEVLKEDKSMCADATTMSKRLESKALQNIASTVGGSIVLAPATVALSPIALPSAAVAGFVGFGLGVGFLGDSFAQYTTAIENATSGIGSAKDVEDAKLNAEFNVASMPFLGPSVWAGTRLAYNAFKAKIAEHIPGVANIMKKAGTNQAKQDQAVNSWMMESLKSAVKNKLLGNDDVDALKSAAGTKILTLLAKDIQKTNPTFFNDPKNFEYFFSTAAASLKRRPGDPADLGDKVRFLFSSLNPEAFDKWDPLARNNLMKVFKEGVEELRETFVKDPAAYAKFKSDPASYEKIMFKTLKRGNVTDDEAKALTLCSMNGKGGGGTALFTK